MTQNEPTKNESDIEEILFKIFGILLIITSIISLFLALTGSNVYREDTVSLDSGKSVTRIMEFDEGQTVYVGYNIIDGENFIIISVEKYTLHGAYPVNLEDAGKNRIKFKVDETQTFYISFMNPGSEEIVFHYEIAIKGYNNNSQCYSVSFAALILGVIVLFAFYKDKIIQI